MWLSSLTLRGFKSFADKTELTFEPGVTVVVGPNGSGKSNVVDALTWVLGTHSPKSLRGSSMADVIFAGAAGRPGLGRAAVEITIDNSAGDLDIEFSEVRISRALFANGESSYAINGVECRQLDIAELLSDTGLGREHHTIVGQGQLDAILNARPEDRRAFIEEAAGILKHRRRKERALRKLAQMETHVERLQDLVRELRRNLRPLERQAEAAARHAELSAALQRVRVEQAVRQLVVLTDRIDAGEGARTQASTRLEGLRAQVQAARADEERVQTELNASAPRLETATQLQFRLANLVERFRGLQGRIEERHRGLAEAVEEPVAGRAPAELLGQAEEQRVELAQVEQELAGLRAHLEQVESERAASEQRRRAHEQAAAAESRRRAQVRERMLRWEGEVSALRSGLAQASSEEGRLAAQQAGLAARRRELGADQELLGREIERLDAENGQLAQRQRAGEQVLERRLAEAAELTGRERALERRRASLEARADALRAATQESDDGAAMLIEAAARGELAGLLGPLADQVGVSDGMADAVAAALGPLGDALVAESATAARRAVETAAAAERGRVVVLAVGAHAADSQRDGELAPLGARPLRSFLRGSPQVLATLAAALDGTYVVEDFEAACRLADRFRSLSFVSRAGEVAGAQGYASGGRGTPSAVVTRAAAEQTEAELVPLGGELRRLQRQMAESDRRVGAARQELEVLATAVRESDGQITAAAERLNRVRKELKTADEEQAQLDRAITELTGEVTAQRERLRTLEERGVEEVEPADEGPDLEAERLDDELRRARQQEVEARLAASRTEQSVEESRRRIGALEREAEQVAAQLRQREERRRARIQAMAGCVELAELARGARERSETGVTRATARRTDLEERRAASQRALGVVRERLRDLEGELGALTEDRHRDELAHQQLLQAAAGARKRLSEDLATEPEAALAQARAGEFGSLDDQARHAVLTEEEDRLARKLGLLGTVNPLAMEEFEALRERQRFLGGQLEDLRASRRDLLQVVDAVDQRIREVFADAFADVAAHFERLFPRLFPGGEGRLVLTDSDDLLESGVEVEARPPGKRVKQLSLLSGGERSLTALALLFAIFAARPSPFYVLDEVEAALDDVNLQRFLGIVEEFRASSQLIIVSHQKRTMEIADVLYGVSMRSGGVSKLVSQRMSEAPAAT